MRGSVGCTPLLIASAIGDTQLVDHLLQLGADPMLCSDSGNSSFMEACISPAFSPELGDLLIAAAPPGYVDFTGRPDDATALHFACEGLKINQSKVEYLVSRGANVNAVDKNRFGALVWTKRKSRRRKK